MFDDPIISTDFKHSWLQILKDQRRISNVKNIDIYNNTSSSYSPTSINMFLTVELINPSLSSPPGGGGVIRDNSMFIHFLCGNVTEGCYHYYIL